MLALVKDDDSDTDYAVVKQVEAWARELKSLADKRYISQPFTNRRRMSEVCDKIVPEIDIAQCMVGTSASLVRDSADELRRSKAWRNATRRSLCNNEAGRRQLMNLIINEAADVAQNILCRNPSIDDADRDLFSARHTGPGDSNWTRVELERDAEGQPQSAKSYIVIGPHRGPACFQKRRPKWLARPCRWGGARNQRGPPPRPGRRRAVGVVRTVRYEEHRTIVRICWRR
ncbi:hypothetical protein C8R47DRAFT_531291 [Mycena vitilis]|nr:hypothetical protein C8R47DRAFT_531291 [Mycena vitilis]